MGDKFRQLRKEQRLTTCDLAQRSGVSQGQISRIAMDDRGFSFENLEAITQTLNVPIRDLPHEIDATRKSINVVSRTGLTRDVVIQ